MKTRLKAVMLAAVMMLAVLMLCACGSGESEEKKPKNEHQIFNANGVMLYEDESIDTGDEDAQAKLEKYLSGKSDDLKKRFNTDFNTTEVYAAANTLVFELDYTKDADEEILGDASKMMEEMTTTMKIADGRESTGVKNLAALYAVVSSEGEVKFSKLMK